MADGMWIAGFLAGVRDIVQTVAPKAQCAVRPSNDGRPGAAYKGGGWFFGVYFAGLRSDQGSSHETMNLSMAVGVDVTRVQPKVPTAELGTWFMAEAELFQAVGLVVEVLTEQNWQVARLCNEAYSRIMGGTRDGSFYEHFDSLNVGGVVNAPPNWIMGVEGQNSPVYYCRATFTGLKFNKFDSQLRKP